MNVGQSKVSGPSGEVKTSVSRRLTILLAAFGAIAPLAIDMYLPGVPDMARDLSVSANDAGMSVSVFFIGMAVGQLVAGPLSDRLGRRPMVFGGLVLFILGGVAAVVAQSFLLLLAARLLQALGACSVTTCSRAAVRDMLEPREAARLFSLLALVGGLIPLVAPTIGNLLLQFAGWRAMFGAMAAGGLLMLGMALFTFTESRSHETLTQSRGENALQAYLTLLRRPRLNWILLAGAFNSGAMFSYLANSPAVLMEGLGLSSFAYTVTISLNSLGLVLFSLFNRAWLKSRSPEDVLRYAAAVSAALGLAFLSYVGLFAGSTALLLVLLFVQMCCAALVQVNTMACALAIDPTRSGSTAALFGSITFAAGAILSWIAGQLYSAQGSGMTTVIGLSLLACSASLAIALSKAGASEAQT